MPGAEELHRRGVAALNRGRHAEARRLLERAAAGLDGAADADLRARIEASLAYVDYETGDPGGALERFDRALSLDGISDDTRGVVHGQIGLVRMLSGDGDAALDAFDVAARLVEADLPRARVHLNRGNVHLQRNAPGRAALDFTEAARFYTAAGDEYGAAKAVHNSGYSRLLDGDIPGALQDMNAAYGAFVAEGPVMTAMADQDRAEALIAAGLVDEGVASLKAAAAAYARRRLYQRQGEADLARARYERDPRDARAAARRAADRFRRGDAPSWTARAEAQELAAEVELGRAGAVADHGDRIAGELDRHRLRWHATGVRLQVARALLERGRADAAARRLRSIRVTGSAPLAVRLDERDVRATAALAAGRRSDALAHVKAGLDDLHAWQSSFGSLDLQTNVVGHGVRLAVQGLSLAVGSRSDRVLFEWSERARMLASRIQPVRTPQDPQTGADLAELRAGPVADREAELRRQIRERAWQRQGSGEVADPMPLAGLQAGLGPDTALVAYVVTAERVVGLVVTADGTRRHELGGAGPAGRRARRAARRPRHGGLRAAGPARRLGARRAGPPRAVGRRAPGRAARRRAGPPPGGADAVRRARRCAVVAAARAGRPAYRVAQSATSWLARRPRRSSSGRPASWRGPASSRRGGGSRGRVRVVARRCWPAARPPRTPCRTWPAASTSCTSPRTAGTPPRTRSSRVSSWSTAPGSATTSTSSPAYRTWCCSRPARWAAPRSAGERS